MYYNLANPKINKLCRIVLEKTQFTQSELENLGFADFEIEELEKADIIYKIINDYYFIGVDLLFQYGKHLLNINLDSAANYFNRCLEIDSHYQKAMLGMFFISLKKHEYNQAYKILENLLATDTENLLKNDNLYFKILSNIHLVPKQLQEKFSNLRKWDVLLENEKRDLTIENDIRLLAYWQRYRKAITKLNKLENPNDLHNMVFKELLYQILWREKERDYYVVDCIKDKNYEELVRILKIEESLHSLSKFSYFILYLSQIYLNLKNTGKVPIKKDVEIKTSHDAIMAYDYKKALELAIEEDKAMGYNKNISKMILIDICALIDFYENNIITIDDENNLIYGIPNHLILKVKKAILMGLDYQKVINTSNLSEEEQDILNLILAQDFYQIGQYNLGDNFLNLILNKRKITAKVNFILEQTLNITNKISQSHQVRTYKKESQN